MQAKISKWGNSLGIRIPGSVAKQVGISEGEAIELIVDNNHIIIRKIYRLEALLAQVTPDNIHSETDTGPAVGDEAW